MVNWLQLHDVQMGSEYPFAALRYKCGLGVLFVGCNTVQSCSQLPTVRKQQVFSERVR
jgi:hypothetical protein